MWHGDDGSFFKKLEVELPCDPAFPFLGNYPKGSETIQKRLLYACVHCSAVHNNSNLETT